MKNVLLLCLFTSFLMFPSFDLKGQINVEKIERSIQLYTSNTDFNGRVVLFDSDSIVYNYMNGYASFQENELITEETTFNVASVGKMITALGILNLIDDGKLKLNTPINEIYPNLPADVQIKHLLNHTSGLQKRVFVLGNNWAKLDETISSETFIEYLTKEPRRSETSEKFEYNNVNYILLYDIFKKQTGQTVEEYLVDKGLLPSLKSSQKAGSYDFNEVNGQWIHGIKMVGNFLAPYEYKLFGPGHYYINPGEAIHVINGFKSLSADLLKEATTPWDLEGLEYGYGIEVKNDGSGPVWSHMGKNYGTRSYLAHYPELNVTLMMVTNTDDPNFHGLWPKLQAMILNNSDFVMPELSIADALGKKLPFLNKREIAAYFYDLEDTGKFYISRPEINDLAFHLWEQNGKEKGIEVLKINADMFPENFRARYYYAEGLDELDDCYNAIANYEQALDIMETQLEPSYDWFGATEKKVQDCRMKIESTNE